MQLASGVDHVLTLVRDLDAAAAAFERLGFLLTPRGEHTGQGTGNACVMLASGHYLELLGVLRPTERNAGWRTMLEAGHEGPAALALATEDEERALAGVRALGFGPGDIIRLARRVTFAGGEGTARFGVVRIAQPIVPWLKLFFCRHHTRELLWRPEWMAHPNGARALLEVVALSPDPAAARGLLASLAGARAVAAQPGLVRVTLGGASLLIMDPDRYRDWAGGLEAPASMRSTGLVGVTIRVEDLARASRVIEASGAFMVGGPGWLMVPPPEAAGTMLKLVA